MAGGMVRSSPLQIARYAMPCLRGAPPQGRQQGIYTANGGTVQEERKMKMFTTVDKALVALIMGVISILNLVFGINIGIAPETVSAIIAAITPLLVYLIPNKKPA